MEALCRAQLQQLIAPCPCPFQVLSEGTPLQFGGRHPQAYCEHTLHANCKRWADRRGSSALSFLARIVSHLPEIETSRNARAVHMWPAKGMLTDTHQTNASRYHPDNMHLQTKAKKLVQDESIAPGKQPLHLGQQCGQAACLCHNGACANTSLHNERSR